MTIQQAQDQIDEWIKKVGVRYFSEVTNMAILAEEAGELSHHIARIYGEQSYKDKTIPLDERKAQMADEMADVLWVLLCLANQTGVNMTDALEKNIAKKNNRDIDRHKNNDKLK